MPLPFFSSERFLEAVAAACFPGRLWRLETVSVEGQVFRVLVVNDRVIHRLWHHTFYYEPISRRGDAGERRVPFLSEVCHDIVPAGQVVIARPLSPAPFIDWRPFDSFEDYRQFTTQLPRQPHWKRVKAYRRKLQRTLGEVEFAADDPRPDTLLTLLRWKSEQVQGWGFLDSLSDPAAPRLYEELRSRGLLTVTTIRAGGELVAGVAGYRWDGRFCFRLTAHNPTMHRYSPGQMLLQELLQHSFDRGDEQFDFMEGRDAYKLQYATHIRIIGPLGTEPAGDRARNWVQTKARSIQTRWRQRNILLRPREHRRRVSDEVGRAGEQRRQ